MIAIVRHGAREDDSSSKKRRSEVTYDPALSRLGEEQSRITGRYFANTYLSVKNSTPAKHVKILASPFLRTLQTAVIIARELNIKGIQVWDPLCEELSDDIFDSFPLPKINYYSKSNGFICNNFLRGDDVKITKMEDPERILLACHYPEKKENRRSNLPQVRARIALNYIINTQLLNIDKNTEPNREIKQAPHGDFTEMIILVSHAFFLLPFVKYFSPEDNYKDRDYCAISVAKKINSEDWKIIEECSSEHLK